MNKKQFKAAFIKRALALFGFGLDEVTPYGQYEALASLVRDYIGQWWVDTKRRYDKGEKQVYYFSIEFLPGRFLDANLQNIGVKDSWSQALAELGINYEELARQEQDAGLGNGGLGRLAACFLDSMASLGLPGHGCGIHYTCGLFKQEIINGEQVEKPDTWSKDLNIWEYRRPDKAVTVNFGPPLGTVLAVPHDIPIIGFRNKTVNTLRLWSAEVREDLEVNLSAMTPDDYQKRLKHEDWVEALSEMLYPDDRYEEFRILRMLQEYFLASAGVQSIVRHVKSKQGGVANLPEKVAIHINDTHPALAIPELMRVLIDEEGLDWDTAWRMTTSTVSYTNHTVLPEALEKWPIDKFRTLLPRIYEIINEINERFCRELWQRYPGEWDRIAAMAIIAYGYVHMANLAIVGSHSVNGVAKLHTEILQKDLFKLFYQLNADKFNNKTNGINHRRWLLQANPELAGLIDAAIGPNWHNHPEELTRLKAFAADQEFQEKLAAIKLLRKQALAKYILDTYNISVDVNSIFDIHVKRIHAYKRQLLNALRIMDLYNQLKNNPELDILPRTFIFAGKAAQGYFLAKKIIKLINALAVLINNDPVINGKIKMVFIENYGVSLAEMIIPAADISEQISTAGKEASGTSNMKFMMNGAIIVGTLDGANIEIQETVGEDNILIFGLKAGEVVERLQSGKSNPADVYHSEMRVSRCINQLIDGTLFPNKDEFRPLYDYLLGTGEFFELQDFAAYLDVQAQADLLFRDQARRWSMAIANIAGSGVFSSDRTVSEYASDIWKIRAPGKRKA